MILIRGHNDDLDSGNGDKAPKELKQSDILHLLNKKLCVFLERNAEICLRYLAHPYQDILAPKFMALCHITD